jgi:uncharacterized membrane protein
MAWSDEQVDRAIGNLLRAGVSLAALIVLAAGIWFLVRHGGARPDYATFRGEPAEFRGVAPLVAALPHGRAADWIQLGLLLLIATPVTRVAFSIFAFAAQRDWTYVAITAIVLGVLVYSLFSVSA